MFTVCTVNSFLANFTGALASVLIKELLVASWRVQDLRNIVPFTWSQPSMHILPRRGLKVLYWAHNMRCISSPGPLFFLKPDVLLRWNGLDKFILEGRGAGGWGGEGVQYVRGGGGGRGGGWVRCSGGRRPLTLRLFRGFWPGSSWLEAAGTGSEFNTCYDGSLHVIIVIV